MSTKKLQVVKDEFTWEEIPYRSRLNNISDDQIHVSLTNPIKNENKNKKPIIIIRFGKEILKKLNCTENDRLILLQAKENIYNYLLVKANNGHRITKVKNSIAYRVAFRFSRKGLNEFPATNCKWTHKEGSQSIHIVFPCFSGKFFK